MKKYVAERIQSVTADTTDEEQLQLLESVYEILTERGYNQKNIVKMITDIIVSKIGTLSNLLDKNIYKYEDENQEG